MSSPDGPDEGHIADTGMFQRFVAQESEQARAEPAGAPRWAWPLVIVLALVVIGMVVWLLVG